MTSRYWILTINNPTEKFEDFQSDNLKVLVGQKEVGDNGTEHWQLYAEFGTPVRLGGVKRMFGNRCHSEKRRGTRGEAVTYFTKKEIRRWYNPTINSYERDDVSSTHINKLWSSPCYVYSLSVRFLRYQIMSIHNKDWTNMMRRFKKKGLVKHSGVRGQYIPTDRLNYLQEIFRSYCQLEGWVC